jgi:hypothetical protein
MTNYHQKIKIMFWISSSYILVQELVFLPTGRFMMVYHVILQYIPFLSKYIVTVYTRTLPVAYWNRDMLVHLSTDLFSCSVPCCQTMPVHPPPPGCQWPDWNLQTGFCQKTPVSKRIFTFWRLSLTFAGGGAAGGRGSGSGAGGGVAVTTTVTAKTVIADEDPDGEVVGGDKFALESLARAPFLRIPSYLTGAVLNLWRSRMRCGDVDFATKYMLFQSQAGCLPLLSLSLMLFVTVYLSDIPVV